MRTASIAALVTVALTASAADRAPYSSVKPVLDALREQLPAELANHDEAKWNAWSRQEDAAIRARLDQGDLDSLVNLLLFGTSFTRQPRIQIEALVEASVIRGGVGVVYSPTSNASGSATSGANAGTPAPNQWLFQLKDGMPSTVKPVWPAFDPANAVLPGVVGGAPAFLDPNAGRPSRQVQWSLGLQREINRNLVVEASYVANRVVWQGGGGLATLNTLTPEVLAKYGFTNFTSSTEAALLTATISGLSAANRSTLAARGVTLTPYSGFPTSQIVRQTLYPYPQFTANSIAPTGAPLGKVWYDALQITATQRLMRGLSMNANYTWSKTLDLMGSPDILNRKLGKDLAGNDLPHQFRLSAEYTVPKLTRGMFGNKFVSAILSDWGMGWYISYQSGLVAGSSTLARPTSTSTTPISQFLGRGPGNAQLIEGQPLYSIDWVDYDGNHRTDELDINCHCFDPTKTIVFNKNAWANIPDGQWGAQQTSIRQFRTFRQPQESVNFSRNFRFKERMVFQIRAEFANAFNRTRLPNPNVGNFNSVQTTNPTTGLYSGGFGTVVPTGGTAGSRSGTMIARFTF